MAKKKKEMTSVIDTKKVAEVEDRYLLPGLLIKGANEEVLKQFSDYQLDRTNEKFKLLSGEETSWSKLLEAHLKYQKYINDKVREWKPTFPEEIYRQWRRLNGWDMNAKSRPKIFASFTVRDIYGSLPREIYTALDDINDYIYPGVRAHRFFQLLTKECHDEVVKIIETAIKMATASKDIYEYRLKLAAVYGKPFSKTVFQMDAFRNNDKILASI